MVGQNKVVYLNTNCTPSAGVKLLNELCALAHTRLEGLLRQTLDQVDDALFDRAEKAGSNADQTMYFATMRQVRLSRRTVLQAFAREMDGAFVGLREPDARASAAAQQMSYSLELMDESVVEENVAADTAVGKLRTRCALPLAQLQARLDELVVERDVDEDVNPLDPRQIVDAFVVAIGRFDIAIQPKLIIFKLFEKQALLQLPALYEAANRLLADAGILPKPGTSGESRGPGGSQSTGSVAPSDAGSVGDVAEDEGGATLELLQELLAHLRTEDPSPAAAAPGISRSDLVQALSALQQQPSVASGVSSTAKRLNAEELRALLRRSRGVGSGSDAPRFIERAANDTIDIVSMLFDAILDDERLAPSIKALIARLQIPVLKVAMLEPSFFNNRRHPARALINELAQAAMGWAEPENRDADPLYRKMTEVMTRILEGFGEDVGLFEQVLQDFRQFLDQERERARTVEARTRQAAEGKAKVDEARERVQSEIDRRLRVGSVPEIVRQILDGAWFKVLFITCVKDGPQGQLWESRLELMDRLIWSVQPAVSPEKRRQVLASIPALLNDLRAGLEAILYNPSEMTRLFKDLEAEHIRCLSATTDGSAGDAAINSDARVPSAPEHGLTASEGEPSAEVELPALTEEQRIREEYVQRLANVDLGTWFEFTTEGGRQLRAKLSARLNGGQRLIFVNRAGFKLVDKKTQDVADDLGSGRTFILDHNMLFDKALEQVITNLRDLRNSQAL